MSALIRDHKAICFGLVVGLTASAVMWVMRPADEQHQGEASSVSVNHRRTFKSQPTERLQDLREAAVAFREDRSLSEREMVFLLGELSNPLSEDEITLLLSWLVQSEGSHLSQSSRIFVANEVMTCLQSQPYISSDFAEVLSVLAGGKGRYPIALRGYAIQHMRAVWERASRPQIKEFMEKSLWKAVDFQESNLQATALLSLHELTEGDGTSMESASTPRIATEKLAGRAEEFLSNPEIPADLRMVSLRILKERQVERAAPLFRKILMNERETVAMRLSSIHALGDFGSEQDVDLLRSVRAMPFHEEAVNAALVKLDPTSANKSNE